MLVGKGLRKVLGGAQILHGIDLQVSPGEVVALMGPSGAGKTTLLRALSLVEPADEGLVEVDGVPFSGRPADWSGRPWPLVTVVFQDLFLWPHLTNSGNISLPLRERGDSRFGEKVREVSEALSITAFLNRYPTEISRGQRQLVALARAVALQPRYLLLDEVSASLDIERASMVGDLLRRLADGGVGILLITHQLAFARHSCDSLAYIANGRLVEQGPPSILDSPQSPELSAFVRNKGHAI